MSVVREPGDPRVDEHAGGAGARGSQQTGRRRLSRFAIAAAVLVLLAAGIRASRGGEQSTVSGHAASTTAPAGSPPRTRLDRVPVRHPVSTVSAPVVRQALHNDCEATALQILLASVGVHSDQLSLQRQLPRSGPPDPIERQGQRVWGDPELGFVGRADGGGTAGGYGVYQRPVAAVARLHHVSLTNLSRQAPQALYRRLRAGHAVMTWIALSFGPYGTWRSPQGRLVHANFGEHTVVLTGVTRHTVRLVNPLHGTRETWTRADFEARWRALGRRALAAG